IKGYFLISKEQATKAFRLAVAASIWGMLLLTAAVIVGFTSQNTAAAIIAAASGAVVEIFAGSVLVVYNRTLSQLNYYYSKLHNNERLLVLINLVDKLSGDTKKDALFTAIIKSELKSLALAEDTAALSQAAAPDPSAPALAVAAASDNTATPADAPAASPANAGGQQSASGGSGSPADHGSQKPAAK
ncbi:MAG: hypothetical protein FWC59_01575, partial [Actinomycetia bacterium]|nr:hypothetical protein [Actinomycetes bacterium]